MGAGLIPKLSDEVMCWLPPHAGGRARAERGPAATRIGIFAIFIEVFLRARVRSSGWKAPEIGIGRRESESGFGPYGKKTDTLAEELLARGDFRSRDAKSPTNYHREVVAENVE